MNTPTLFPTPSCVLALVVGLALSILHSGCSSAPKTPFNTNNDTYLNISDFTGTVRVACVGDSITYGAGIENRDAHNYPYQLGLCLGPKFETANFGVNGATLLKKGDLPYWNTPAFQQVSSFQPHVVILLLGTNDTKPQNWAHESDFEEDYRALLHHFQALPSKPLVLACFPPPIVQEQWGINPRTLLFDVFPKIRKVAREEVVPIIDLHEPLVDHPEFIPDFVHPNSEGAAIIASTICNALTHKP